MSSVTLIIRSFALFRTISASPLYHHRHAKRNTTSQNVGSGFAIAICIVLLAGVFYYLGMRHERSKSWFLQRKAPVVPEANVEFKSTTEKQGHKRQISCPLAVSSSAPIKTHEDPIEAPAPSLRYYELPIKEIHEMGLPSPKKPPPRASWLSLDRKPWWLKYPEQEERRQSAGTSRSKSMRSWFRAERNMDAVQEDIPIPSTNTVQSPTVVLSSTTVPSPTIVPPERVASTQLDEVERKSDGSTLMDWSGLDYVRKIYVGRKSRVGL